MAGKKGMKHYPVATKREAVRLYQEEGKSYKEITELLEIADRWRVKRWLRDYRRKGEAAFQRDRQSYKGGRPPKRENSEAYIARLEMENDLLKKFHANCASWNAPGAISAYLPRKGKIRSKGDVRVLWCFAGSIL